LRYISKIDNKYLNLSVLLFTKLKNIYMANKKSEENKKAKISCTINEKLLNKLDVFLEKEEISKRSRYIEMLIREDMKKRGMNVEINF